MIVTVQTRFAGSSGPSSVNHTPHRSRHAPSPAVSVSSLLNMEDLDLELNSMHLPHSRPIGGNSKFRSTTQTTHLSHSVIAEWGGGGGGGWGGGTGRELVLMATKVNLKPGENKITLHNTVSWRGRGHGQGRGGKGWGWCDYLCPPQGTQSGEFVPHKVSLKYGSLDFVYTVPSATAREHVISVQDPQVNVDIALSPQEGGEPHPLCQCSTDPLPPFQCFSPESPSTVTSPS